MSQRNFYNDSDNDNEGTSRNTAERLRNVPLFSIISTD